MNETALFKQKKKHLAVFAFWNFFAFVDLQLTSACCVGSQTRQKEKDEKEMNTHLLNLGIMCQSEVTSSIYLCVNNHNNA